jgi:hypothetical protein
MEQEVLEAAAFPKLDEGQIARLERCSGGTRPLSPARNGSGLPAPRRRWVRALCLPDDTQLAWAVDIEKIGGKSKRCLRVRGREAA